MKAITTPPGAEQPAERPSRIDSSVEQPPDRELRLSRGLSADVGAACNAWLNNRGINTRSWRDFNLGRSPLKRAHFDRSADIE
ncbi:MAG: hypothetical protein WCK77_00985 [Verrucomicrobiota bacterium]